MSVSGHVIQTVMLPNHALSLPNNALAALGSADSASIHLSLHHFIFRFVFVSLLSVRIKSHALPLNFFIYKKKKKTIPKLILHLYLLFAPFTI